MAKSPIDNIVNKKCECPEDSVTLSSGNSLLDIPASKCIPPQKVIINYGEGGITEVGNLIQGDNVILSGNLIGRLVGIGDVVIEAVIPPVDLSNYYTKTELQTSGQSQVHWDNLTNVPSIQSPLTFENGLREDGGVVKLGLDLTDPTLSKGILTEATYLFQGNLAGNNATGIAIDDSSKAFSMATGVDSNNSANFNLNLTRTSIVRRSNGSTQQLYMSDDYIIIQDDVNQKGLEEGGDYSANKTAYSYVTKMMLDDVAAQIPVITTPTLQEVTTQGNTSNNAIQITGDNNTAQNVDGLFAMYQFGAGRIGLYRSNSVAGELQLTTTSTTLVAPGTTPNAPRLVLQETGAGVRFVNASGTVRIPVQGGDALIDDHFITKRQLDNSIPDLTGYATEAWVTSQGYLTSVSSSWNINTGDLTIQGNNHNLDGRYMLRSNTITSGYGITASGDFTNPVNIEVDTTTLDNRYLRKDVNDSNSTFNLSLGTLDAGDTLIDGTFTLSSLASGLITDEMVVRDSVTGVIKSIVMPNFGGTFTIANNAGASQFTVASGEVLRFNATGDASVAFNAGTKTITINSSGGSTGGGVDSFNARTGAVVPESGDYTTAQVTESGNLYFTQARVRETPLTGLSVNNSAITATDNILQAFGKAQGQINALVPNTRTISINGTTGNVTVSGGTQTLAANRAWTVNLATVGTAGANKTKVTTDAYGRVISSAALTLSDLPSSVVQNLSINSSTGTSPWRINISGGNNIDPSFLQTTLYSPATFDDLSLVTSYFTSWRLGASAGGFGGTSAGIRLVRQSNSEVSFAWDLGMSFTSGKLMYRYTHTAGSSWANQTLASESWVLDQIPTIPTNYVNTTGSQTGIAGNKTWTGRHIFGGGISGTTRLGIYDGDTGSAGGANMGSLLVSNAFADASNVPANGIWSKGDVIAASYLLILGGSSNTVSGGTILSLKSPTNTPQITFHSNTGAAMGRIGFPGDSSFYINTGGLPLKVSSLTGTGTRMVVASANGSLSTQPISGGGGTVTSVAISSPGAALNVTGGPITASGTFTLSFTGTSSQVVRGDGALTNANGHNHTWSQLGGGSTALIPGAGSSGTWGSLDISGVKGAYAGIRFTGTTDNTTFMIRASDNYSGIMATNWVWAWDGSGSLAAGTVPWSRITGAPSIPTVNNGTLTMSTGTGLTGSATFSANQSSAVTFSVGLAQATATARGGIEIFSNTVQSVAANAVSATASRTYGIQLNSAGQAVVNVPWTNTTYTVGNGTITVSAGNGLTGGGSFTTNQTGAGTISFAIGAGTGIDVNSTSISITNIASGSTGVGALRYNGTSKSSGRLYGGTANPTNVTRLNYDGIIHAYDFVGYGTSDARLKEQIIPITNPLEKLSQIGGYSFKWKDGHDSYQGDDYGVIAQEVEKVLPEIVNERGGVKAIKTGNQLTGLLIAGFNELVKRVEAIENGVS